jgi:hypothetical protein
MVSNTPIHHVKFWRNRLTGHCGARCSGCGWIAVGTQEEVTNRAATHDLEWEVVPELPAAAEAVPS